MTPKYVWVETSSSLLPFNVQSGICIYDRHLGLKHITLVVMILKDNSWLYAYSETQINETLERPR